MLLRPSESRIDKIFRSTPRQYYFDCPLQTGPGFKPPSKEAFSTCHDIQINDIIILATDGVWDNVFDNEVISMIEKKLGQEARRELSLQQLQELSD
jgi:serine/threonine protein phosphatase PrpC